MCESVLVCVSVCECVFVCASCVRERRGRLNAHTDRRWEPADSVDLIMACRYIRCACACGWVAGSACTGRQTDCLPKQTHGNLIEPQKKKKTIQNTTTGKPQHLLVTLCLSLSSLTYFSPTNALPLHTYGCQPDPRCGLSQHLLLSAE